MIAYMSEQVVLVDKNDNSVGLMEKLAAHRGSGTLHRAISVLLYRKKNGKTQVLLQKRSKNKPLWPLFWSNTVCTHPRDGEAPVDCAVRRLQEEMGIDVDPAQLVYVCKLLYRARYLGKFSEYELDHVFVVEWDGVHSVNDKEAAGSEWKPWVEIKKTNKEHGSVYTPWFRRLIKMRRMDVLIGGDHGR